MLFKWLMNLQLFAEGGDGGAGTGASGVAGGEAAAAAPVPEEQRLRDLGVPEAVLKKRANRRGAKTSAGTDHAAAQADATVNAQAAAVPSNAPTTDESATPAAKRMTWDEIMADEEYNKQMQQTMNRRLRSAKDAESKLNALTPALEVLARKYGLDETNIDHAALEQAISGDKSLFEEEAFIEGQPVEKHMTEDRQRRDTLRAQRQEQATLEEQRMNDHFAKLVTQGEALKAVFKDFDLQKELENPVFFRMTSPNIGLSVEDAYYAVHRNEIQTASMQVAAQKAAEKVSSSVLAGQRRPNEAGTAAQAPSVTTFDYKSASKAQRQSLKDSIYAAAARGEKIYPGQR